MRGRFCLFLRLGSNTMSATEDLGHWLQAARSGSDEALGRALQACRGYLMLVAQKELDPALRAKGGASDLVQETLLDAVRAFPQFQGQREEELLAWLRRMLLNNVVSFARRYRDAGKRQVGREIPLENGSGSRERGAGLAAEVPTPSVQAMANENDAALERALVRLPEDYRTVLMMRYRDDLSFEEIGERTGRTANAARKLWARAVEKLQDEMEKPP
jgi:RNA polymerase sigma-70 factor (ECF subfamily)